ncbi:MbnP family copper-binding protein [Hyalangium rubrum]|uniref:Metallo-mystery pair system four-Cys motif protein n=1 Tax=Hyalangium rubrum TaxID=3103134 RepID=A0ABU5H2I9_9BACT|nr:MbnP family copper-binding protein [Hyalangium sp. s54d21]MDY7227531.1 metallo-mystery pair system four-Cys motif protein [Hyalangium sp. s54d21]
MHTSLGRAALLALTALASTACGGDDAPQTVLLSFKPMVGNQAFACGQTYTGLGTTATRYEPKDFRLYVHNVRLVSTGGQEVPVTLTENGDWQKDGLALLDFENKAGLCSNGTEATNNRIMGTVPAGDYSGLRFTVGVPFAMNHQDASVASTPLNVSTLFWGWAGGYKFIRLDGRTSGLPSGHNVHLGSTECQTAGPNQVTSCQQENRFEVELAGFDPEKAQNVVLDVATLLAGSDLDTNQANSAPGCMSATNDADCGPIFQRLGLAFNGTQANPANQTFFRVE